MYEHATKDDVKNAILKLRARFFPGNEEEGMASVFNAVWKQGSSDKDNMSAFVKKADPSVAMSQATFESICEDMGGKTG